MLDRIRRAADVVSLTLGLSAISWVFGYAAGRLASGAPDAPLWLQASSTLAVLVLAGVQVWIALRQGTTAGR